MAIITELFYLPPIEYFVAILNEREVFLDLDENYQKQTYRNRTQIRLANKIETLSIPVIGGNKKVKTSQVIIDHNQKWMNVHLRGIQSAYGKAPFFEFYFPYIEQVFLKKFDLLTEFNRELLTVCLKLLRVKANLKLVGDCDLEQESIDLRGVIRTKEEFTQRDIMTPYHYPQMFGLDFVPNLSILDLLFCMGPESLQVLLHSKKNH